MGLRHGNLPIPSNVTRISQAIKPVSASGITQVIYYQVGLPTGYIGRNPGSGNILKASQAGVGSTGNFLNRIVGGATAEGISDNIRSGYSFIANNYAAGDEIILFGFSRGAFTVRSIAELIDGVGLLTKTGLPFLAAIFKDFKNRRNPKYRPVNPDLPFPNRPSADGPTYREQLRRVCRVLWSVIHSDSLTKTARIVSTGHSNYCCRGLGYNRYVFPVSSVYISGLSIRIFGHSSHRVA